ncbi:hypothetical protein M5K25_025688 [Dendrobium thyrsiflorum]|uniref:AAA+ ATPase domain-containing protein n=1 Tax=Dendrobium thyrsiflorum TaxID=117978 RepID=A0ABD0U4I8_DENTH
MESQTKANATSRSFLTIASSVAASAMIARTFFPRQLQTLISSPLLTLRSALSTDHTILILESEPHLFLACKTYLSSIISSSTSKFKATKHKDATTITLSLVNEQEFLDVFHGVEFRWRLLTRNNLHTVYVDGQPKRVPQKIQFFELCFHKNHKNTALNSYLRYILDESERIRAADRSLKIHTNKGCYWVLPPAELLHPATFETLAMDSELKQRIVEDLSRFSKSKEWYKEKGKPWTRSYLLHGPSGTGKSSLIAAMAKFLRLDIYDLNIKELHWNSGIKLLLLGMSSRSMLVVEDIDCFKKPSSEDGDFSLSGLLGFVDWMWASTGEERMLVFTAKKKDRVDPILLQPGRVDMCLPIGYCRASGFKVLAWNHHGINEHWRFREIEGLLEEVEVTPAEVGEELMRSEDVDVALDSLVQFLHRKRRVESGVQNDGGFSGERNWPLTPAMGGGGGRGGRSFGGLRHGRRGGRVVRRGGQRGRRLVISL